MGITVLIDGPRRSGTTLMSRLFDSEPGIIDIAGDGWFWEHVYNYSSVGKERLFLDIFKTYGPEMISDGIVGRDILPFLNGVYHEEGVAVDYNVKLKFDMNVFNEHLVPLKRCLKIEQVWCTLVKAYARASEYEGGAHTHTVFKCTDYGKSILSAKSHLPGMKSIFIMRNPFFAIDSLKKSRLLQKRGNLHTFNLAEILLDYLFFWEHKEEILNEDSILVQYEELLMDPDKIMRGVAEHLGILYNKNLSVPTVCGEAWYGNSSFKSLNGIDSSVLNNSIRELNSEDIEFIGFHLNELLNYYRYGSGRQMPEKI